MSGERDALVQHPKPPSFEVIAWVSGGTGTGHGGRVAVEEAVEVRSAFSKDTLQAVMGVDAATAKAKWLAHCTRVGVDTIACIVRGGTLLPDLITLDPPSSAHPTCEPTHQPPPFGQAFTILLEGAGGERGRQCNGTYRPSGSHNGKPIYLQDGGPAKIYFSNFWKIDPNGSTGGWIYGVNNDSGRGAYPPSTWCDDGYSGDDHRPFPTLKFIASKATFASPASNSEASGLLQKFFDSLPQAGVLMSKLDKKSQDWMQLFRDRCATGETASTPTQVSPLNKHTSSSPASRHHQARATLRPVGEEDEEGDGETTGAYDVGLPLRKGGDDGEGLPLDCYMAMAVRVCVCACACACAWCACVRACVRVRMCACACVLTLRRVSSPSYRSRAT